MKLTDFVSKNFPQVLSSDDILAVENFELGIMTRGLKVGLFEVMDSRAFDVHRPGRNGISLCGKNIKGQIIVQCRQMTNSFISYLIWYNNIERLNRVICQGCVNLASAEIVVEVD